MMSRPVVRIAPLIAAVVLTGVVLAARQLAPPPTLAVGHDGLVAVPPAAPGTVVRYTLDGTDPVRDSGAWLAPVVVPPGYQLKARAFTTDGTPVGGIAVHDAPPTGASPRRPASVVPVTQNRDWRLYDWAERHRAAVALMQARRPEIVMLGDSITHFWGGEPTGGRTSGRMTGAAEWDRAFAGRRVVNLGYGWDRTENVLWRLTHGEFDDVTPAVVVILIGTNNVSINTPDEIAAGIAAICAEIHRRSSSTRILLLGLLPRGERPNPAREAVAEVNRRIAGLDGRDGVTYLDIGGVFLTPDGTVTREVMYDFLHPTARGYQLWWQAMAPTLERLAKQ
jgi:lysophospholipase L1-like esterase